MGGEASMMAANNSLKNNRCLVSKRKEKNNLSGSYNNVEMKEFPSATNEDLVNLREKIQIEPRKASNINSHFGIWTHTISACIYLLQ